MNCASEFLLWTAKYGIWDIISILVLSSSFITVIVYLYLPKRKIQNLHFYLEPGVCNGTYPLRLYLEIRNNTETSIVLSNALFKFKTLKPDPTARGDLPTKKFEMKFGENFTDLNCLIRTREKVRTWVPINSEKHSKDEIQSLIDKGATGKFECLCTIMKKRPQTYRLCRTV